MVTLLWSSIMLAVVNQPHIKFSFEGTPDVLFRIVDQIRTAFPTVQVTEGKGKQQKAVDMDWYKQAKASLTPAKYLACDRFNANLTQKQLAESTGILQQHLSAMERGKRTIGKMNAQKLGKALHTDFTRYL